MMDFQHSGSDKRLLDIEVDNLKVFFTGKYENEKFNIVRMNENVKAHLNVKSNIDELRIRAINYEGELEENYSKRMLPAFFEDKKYNLIINSKDDIDIYHGKLNITENLTKIDNYYFVSLSFNGDVGYSEIKIKTDKGLSLYIIIEVFPTKIDYYKDYNEILSEVNEEISSMIFDFLGNTFKTSKLVDVENQTGVEFIEILNKIFNKFESSINYVVNNFKHSIINVEKKKRAVKTKRISKTTVKYLRNNKRLLQKSKYGIIDINDDTYYPHKVVEKSKITTIDIYENRYIKNLIKNTMHRIRVVKQNIKNNYDSSNYYYKILDNFENKLNKYLNIYFREISDLNYIHSIPLSFRLSYGYREVFYFHNLMKKGLDVSEGLYNITPKKIWNLYEIWCFIKIHRILADLGYKTQKNDIISVSTNGISLSLTSNTESKIVYKNNNNKEIELWYNKKYPYLPTTNQRPDTVLFLRSKNNKDRMYIFDAKYRFNIDNNGNVGPMEEDINAMHRYRDAIVSELEDSFQFKYDTFGAYVMFPYHNEKEYQNHKYYNSIEKVNIGAFPMLPGSTNLIKKRLLEITDESYIESLSQKPKLEVEDDYYKFKNTNVMVANVKDKEHFKKYIEKRFIHIPVKSISNIRLGVEYVAFYQSKKAFNDESGIKCYAKIKDVYKYKRKECKEIPTNKNDNREYLRIELYEPQDTGHIEPVEYGIELITYTTLYLLKNAETLHELKFKNYSEIKLYKTLKELSKKYNKKIYRRKEHFIIGNNKVRVVNNKKLRLNNKIIDWTELIHKIKE